MMTKRQITALKDQIETFTDLMDDFLDVLDELEHLRKRVRSLEADVEWLEFLFEEYGIDPNEKRQWRIDAVSKFVQELGV